MKVLQSGLNIHKQKLNKINFGSYRPEIDDYGEKKYNFYVAYDSKKYNADLEFYEAQKKDGIWHADITNPIKTIHMDEKGIALSDDDIADLGYKLAYRYKITEKNNPANIKYILDNGTHTEEKGSKNAATVLYTDRLILSGPQNAILIMPDMYYGVHKKKYSDEIEYGLKKDTLRNHFNKLGGNIPGITEKIPELQKAGYKKIVGTPFTKDIFNSNKYWTNNAYLLDPELASEEDYKNLQEALVANGMGWIADGAFVNEGIEGVHFKSVLKWGDRSPFKNWFYFYNKLEPITLGIFPEKSDNVNFKLINGKYNLFQDNNTKEIIAKSNENYNPKAPTYVQFFDKRLVSELQASNDEIITSYDKIDIDSGFNISSSNDSVTPYAFEINTKILLKNIKDWNKYTKSLPKEERQNLQNTETMKALFSSDNYVIDKKSRMSGYEAWEGNTDIPKMNLHVSNADIETFNDYDLKNISKAFEDRYIGFLQVKDYVANAGRYWTNKTKNIQTLYVANQLGNPDNYSEKIQELIENKKLPESVNDIINDEIINNVINDNYNIAQEPLKTKKDAIMETIDSFPLDALNFSDELAAVFSSPYISKRPFKNNDINKTRTDICANNYKDIPSEYRSTYAKFDKLLRTEVYRFIESAFDLANQDVGENLFAATEKNPIIKPYTAETMKLLLPEMVKKVLEMSVMINLLDKPKSTQIDVDSVMENIENITPQHLNIFADSPEAEANQLIDKIAQGLKYMNNPDVDVANMLRTMFRIEISNLYKNVNENSLKLAKIIVDKGDTGLGWRIDAAKDVSNMNAVRTGQISFDDAWDNVIDVWADFTNAVRQENPNAYITAELTDVNCFAIKNDTAKNIKYDTEEKAELAFLEETGITSFANYKYFFSALNNLYKTSTETGKEDGKADIDNFRKGKFIEAWDGNRNFLEHGPYDAVKGSYNFNENHDKPRILHTNALDMPLFHGSFVNSEEKDRFRNTARKVFGYDGKYLSEYDFTQINPKAVAMADRLDKALNNLFNEKYGLDGGFFNQGDEALYRNENNKVEGQDMDFMKNFHKAAAQLAWGTYKGKDFEPSAFGVRPFDITLKQVFEQMKYNGFEFENEDKMFKEILTKILKPACDDAYKMYKYLITFPGMTTDFAGHKQGSTGYESKSNNLYQQNRNRVHMEWTSPETPSENIECVKDFEQKTNKLMQLKKDKALSALSDGDTIVLPEDGQNKNVMALFRYNDKGSKVITVYNPTYETKSISRILLNDGDSGLIGGLKEGMRFVNAENPSDDSYIVTIEDGKYCIKKNGEIKIEPNEGDVLILKSFEENETKPYIPSFSGIQAFNTYKNSLDRAKKSSGNSFSKIL